VAEAFGNACHELVKARVYRRVTRVNAERASKSSMRRPTRQPYWGRLIRLGE
jgi:hypothetical protein